MKITNSSLAIVTAVDEAFKSYIGEWIGCMLDHKIIEIADLVVFDCGLSPATRAAIASHGVQVLDAPEHKIHVEELPRYFAAQTMRPALPGLLPDYEYIMWIDSDCWIQEGRAVQDYLDVARISELACATEHDRGYRVFSQSDVHAKAVFDQERDTRPIYEYWVIFFSRFFPDELSRRLAAYPHINGGVFCAHRDSPVWQAWADMLDACMAILAERKLGTDFLGRRFDLIVDQTALNAAVHLSNIDVNYMPATYNWVCHRSLPLYDEATGRLTEQCWPFDSIKILHLTTGEIKAVERFKVPILHSGRVAGTREMSLRCPGSVPL